MSTPLTPEEIRELREKAEKLLAVPELTVSFLHQTEDAFQLAANPTAVLRLLDELEANRAAEARTQMAIERARCANCGCLCTAHEVDDEELRACEECECKQYMSKP